MSNDQNHNEEAVDNLEIEPLSEDDLETVAGGAWDCKKKSCSGSDCSGGGNDDTDVDADVQTRLA
ncbi:MAG: hypothetical protein AAF772_04375 [Acidobacteriota bacterium]